MAAHLAATAGAGHSRWQVAGATADAEARHSGSRQAEVPGCHHRQPAQPAGRAECARSQVHGGRAQPGVGW
jgi:hypothetical protein